MMMMMMTLSRINFISVMFSNVLAQQNKCQLVMMMLLLLLMMMIN